MFDAAPPPKLWLPSKPAIIRAASLDDAKLAMPLMGTFAAASVRGFRSIKTLVETLYDRTTGTNIGNMTAGGGLAAGFDGNNSQAAGTGPRFSGQVGWIGKTMAAPHPISRIQCYPSNNLGYHNNANPTITIRLYGKSGAAPANATDGIMLGSISFADTNTGPQTVTSSDTSTPYDHVWAYIDIGSVNLVELSELVIYVMT